MSNPSDQQSAKPVQMRWQFIDASKDNADNLTQVKRHVMQEYMRHKRLGNQQQDDTAESSERKSSTKRRQRARRTHPAKTASRSVTRKATEADDGPKLPTRTTGEGTDDESDVEEITRTLEGSDPTRPRIIPSQTDPHSLYFGSSYADDFATFPSLAGTFSQGTLSDNGFADLPFDGIYSSPSQGNILSPWFKTASPPPQTVLSAARTDPFDTLPLRLSPEDKHLFDFYVNEMPACSYGGHFRTEKAHNWYTEVFVPEAMKGPVTFVNTVLVHAANTWAWVRNEAETRNTLMHRQRAISMLKDHMNAYPEDISDNAITACMSAAALEDFDPRPGHKEISWIHMRQARRMIRDRGGPAAFENTKLAMLINWQDYIFAGYETEGPSFYFEHKPSYSSLAAGIFPTLSSAIPYISSLPSPPNSTASVSPGRSPSPCSQSTARNSRFPLSPRQEVRLQCEEFIGFLNRCEQLALSQRVSLPKTSAPTRHSAFQVDSTLHRILASPPGERFTASGSRKQFITRLASVMTLNAALWDYRSSIPRAEVFLKSLILKISDSEVNKSGSVEALLQILLACKDGFTANEPQAYSVTDSYLHSELTDAPDFSQYSPTATSPFARPWFVGRMLKIAKRLSLGSWLRVNDLLFSFLTLQVQIPIMRFWENELRREILEAPLTSYVMPALR